MIRIRIEYDAYNRIFKLIDRDFGSILEDGTVYELALPFVPRNLCDDELNSISEVTIPLANAFASIPSLPLTPEIPF